MAKKGFKGVNMLVLGGGATFSHFVLFGGV